MIQESKLSSTVKLLSKKLMKESYWNMKQEKLWVKTFHWIDLVTSLSKLLNKMKKYNFLTIKINQIVVKTSRIQI